MNRKFCSICIYCCLWMGIVVAEIRWVPFTNQEVQLFCGRYAICMSMHSIAEQRCQTIGYERHCKMDGELSDMRILLMNRENQYSGCVKKFTNDTRRLQIQAHEKAACSVIPGEVFKTSQTSSQQCFAQIGAIKQHCDRLQRCCAYAQSCDSEIAGGDISNAILVKKQAIAQKMLECLIKPKKSEPAPFKMETLTPLQVMEVLRPASEIRRRPINYRKLSQDVSVAQQLLRRRQRLYESQIRRVRRLRRITAELARMINKRRLASSFRPPPRAVPTPRPITELLTPPEFVDNVITPESTGLERTRLGSDPSDNATISFNSTGTGIADNTVTISTSLHEGAFAPPLTELTAISDSFKAFADNLEKNTSELTLRLKFDQNLIPSLDTDEGTKKSLAFGVSNLVDELNKQLDNYKQAPFTLPRKPLKPAAPIRIMSINGHRVSNSSTGYGKLPPEAFVDADGLWTMAPTTEGTPRGPGKSSNVVSLSGAYKKVDRDSLEVLAPRLTIVDRDSDTTTMMPQVMYKRTKTPKLPTLIYERMIKVNPTATNTLDLTQRIPISDLSEQRPTNRYPKEHKPDRKDAFRAKIALQRYDSREANAGLTHQPIIVNTDKSTVTTPALKTWVIHDNELKTKNTNATTSTSTTVAVSTTTKSPIIATTTQPNVGSTTTFSSTTLTTTMVSPIYVALSTTRNLRRQKPHLEIIPNETVVDGEVTSRLVMGPPSARMAPEIRKKQSNFVQPSSKSASYLTSGETGKDSDFFREPQPTPINDKQTEISDFFNAPIEPQPQKFREVNKKRLNEFEKAKITPEKSGEQEDFESVMQLERLELLRNPDPEMFDNDVKIGYCNLYAACSDQLKAVQANCVQQSGRLIPGLPKRRGSDCHRNLVPDYQAVDELVAKVEVAFDDCLTEYVGTLRHSANTRLDHHRRHKRRDSTALPLVCDEIWPVLPFYEEKRSCHDRVRVVQNHCVKLQNCCPAVGHCRHTVDQSVINGQLQQRRADLSRQAAECQIRSLYSYRERRRHQQHGGTGKGYRNHGDYEHLTPKIKIMEPFH